MGIVNRLQKNQNDMSFLYIDSEHLKIVSRPSQKKAKNFFLETNKDGRRVSCMQTISDGPS